MTAPKFEQFAPFERLTDEELREAMVMHIRMGYILKNPGKSAEAESVAKDMVEKLSLEQLKQIHPHTFFTNKNGSARPQNPYEMALALLNE